MTSDHSSALDIDEEQSLLSAIQRNGHEQMVSLSCKNENRNMINFQN